MANFRFEEIHGASSQLDRQNLRITRRFRATDRPPVQPSGDYFDWISSQAIAWVRQFAANYQTPMGMLHWNTIQVNEIYYAIRYEITVSYSPHESEAGAYSITVDQSGGSVNVTAGTVIGKFGADAPADLADVPPTIGVQGETVRGVNVPVEDTRISVTFRHPGGKLNQAFIRAIGQLVGFPNSDPFFGYEAGEVIYRGGQLTETDTEATAQYAFGISYNRQNFEVAGITISDKKGWDILDPVYADEVKADAPTKQIKYFKTVRPAGREWKAYRPVFGFGY